MFFRKIFRKPKERPAQPGWVKAILLFFLLFLFAQAWMNPPKNSGVSRTPVQTALDDANTAIRSQKTIDFSGYKNLLYPEYETTLRIKDTQIGKGPLSLCGQHATIAYQAMLPDQKPIDDSATKEKPFVMTIGSGNAMPALEQGIIGMHVGGKRTISSHLGMTYGIEKFRRKELLPTDQVLFDVELLSVSPVVSAETLQPFRVVQVQNSYGTALNCGNQAHVHMIIWDVTGKKLFSTEVKTPEVTPAKAKADTPVNPAASPSAPPAPAQPEPGLKFTVGQSEVFMGLEQGIIGMAPGSVRTLIVPPAMQKTMSGAKPKIDFPLPANQTVLVDVEYLP